uniref:Uncharacterized protein n=1 Tax=Tanacetum cinerariifolium TaxID=118510 RepID=A0A699GF85_TANCI|nr:hypothetical protein [Tanacetum cinerariifolium]
MLADSTILPLSMNISLPAGSGKTACGTGCPGPAWARRAPAAWRRSPSPAPVLGARAVEARVHPCHEIDGLAYREPLGQDRHVGNKAHVVHQQFALGARIAAQHRQVALERRQAQDGFQGGGLARTVGTDQPDDAAGVDGEADAVERGPGAVVLDQAGGGNHVVGSGSHDSAPGAAGAAVSRAAGSRPRRRMRSSMAGHSSRMKRSRSLESNLSCAPSVTRLPPAVPRAGRRLPSARHRAACRSPCLSTAGNYNTANPKYKPGDGERCFSGSFLLQREGVAQRRAGGGIVEDAPAGAAGEVGRHLVQVGIGIRRVIHARAAVQARVHQVRGGRERTALAGGRIGNHAGDAVPVQQFGGSVGEPCCVTRFAGEGAGKTLAQCGKKRVGQACVELEAGRQLYQDAAELGLQRVGLGRKSVQQGVDVVQLAVVADAAWQLDGKAEVVRHGQCPARVGAGLVRFVKRGVDLHAIHHAGVTFQVAAFPGKAGCGLAADAPAGAADTYGVGHRRIVGHAARPGRPRQRAMRTLACYIDNNHIQLKNNPDRAHKTIDANQEKNFCALQKSMLYLVSSATLNSSLHCASRLAAVPGDRARFRRAAHVGHYFGHYRRHRRGRDQRLADQCQRPGGGPGGRGAGVQHQAGRIRDPAGGDHDCRRAAGGHGRVPRRLRGQLRAGIHHARCADHFHLVDPAAGVLEQHAAGQAEMAAGAAVRGGVRDCTQCAVCRAGAGAGHHRHPPGGPAVDRSCRPCRLAATARLAPPGQCRRLAGGRHDCHRGVAGDPAQRGSGGQGRSAQARNAAQPRAAGPGRGQSAGRPGRRLAGDVGDRAQHCQRPPGIEHDPAGRAGRDPDHHRLQAGQRGRVPRDVWQGRHAIHAVPDHGGGDRGDRSADGRGDRPGCRPVLPVAQQLPQPVFDPAVQAAHWRRDQDAAAEPSVVLEQGHHQGRAVGHPCRLAGGDRRCRHRLHRPRCARGDRGLPHRGGRTRRATERGGPARGVPPACARPVRAGARSRHPEKARSARRAASAQGRQPAVPRGAPVRERLCAPGQRHGRRPAPDGRGGQLHRLPHVARNHFRRRPRRLAHHPHCRQRHQPRNHRQPGNRRQARRQADRRERPFLVRRHRPGHAAGGRAQHRRHHRQDPVGDPPVRRQSRSPGRQGLARPRGAPQRGKLAGADHRRQRVPARSHPPRRDRPGGRVPRHRHAQRGVRRTGCARHLRPRASAAYRCLTPAREAGNGEREAGGGRREAGGGQRAVARRFGHNGGFPSMEPPHGQPETLRLVHPVAAAGGRLPAAPPGAGHLRRRTQSSATGHPGRQQPGRDHVRSERHALAGQAVVARQHGRLRAPERGQCAQHHLYRRHPRGPFRARSDRPGQANPAGQRGQPAQRYPGKKRGGPHLQARRLALRGRTVRTHRHRDPSRCAGGQAAAGRVGAAVIGNAGRAHHPGNGSGADRVALRVRGARDARFLDHVRRTRPARLRPQGGRRARRDHHHLRGSARYPPRRGDRQRGRRRALPQSPYAAHLRLPELFFDSLVPPGRRLFRHPVRARSRLEPAVLAQGDGNAQAVRATDFGAARVRAPAGRRAKRPDRRTGGGRAARAVHRRAGPRSAHPAQLHRHRRRRAQPEQPAAAGSQGRRPHPPQRHAHCRPGRRRGRFYARQDGRRHRHRAPSRVRPARRLRTGDCRIARRPSAQHHRGALADERRGDGGRRAAGAVAVEPAEKRAGAWRPRPSGTGERAPGRWRAGRDPLKRDWDWACSSCRKSRGRTAARSTCCPMRPAPPSSSAWTAPFPPRNRVSRRPRAVRRIIARPGAAPGIPRPRGSAGQAGHHSGRDAGIVVVEPIGARRAGRGRLGGVVVRHAGRCGAGSENQPACGGRQPQRRHRAAARQLGAAGLDDGHLCHQICRGGGDRDATGAGAPAAVCRGRDVAVRRVQRCVPGPPGAPGAGVAGGACRNGDLSRYPCRGRLVVYLIAVYLPGSNINRGARKVATVAVKTLDPGRELRAAKDAYEYTPTAQNQMRLAAAQLAAGNAAEAAATYEACLQGPFSGDLEIRFGAARASLESDRAGAAVDHLQTIRTANPQFRAEQVSLLLAQALAASGRQDEARGEFDYALDRHGGFTVQAEYAIWAAGTGNAGDMDQARTLYAELRRTIERWTPQTRDLNQQLIKRLNAAMANRMARDVAVAIDGDPAAARRRRLGLPVGQHVAARIAYRVQGRAVGVAVNHDAGAGLREQRHGEKLLLVRRLAHHGAELHVLDVFRALGVAMHEHQALAGDFRHMDFRQQGQAGGSGKIVADQEVAVAAHPVDGRARIAHAAQRRHDLPVEGVVAVVVAHPVFEQVAQQIQLRRVPRMAFQEIEERCRDGGLRGLQVQIRNEQRAGVGRARAGQRMIHGDQAASSTLSMITSSAGTSANMPLRERVVLDVDEELGRCRVRRRGAGHGQRVRLVFQAVLGFVFHGVVRRLLFHAWLETAALDHEAVDYAVEDGVVVVAGVHISQEVFHGLRCGCIVQLGGDLALFWLDRGFQNRCRLDGDGRDRDILEDAFIVHQHALDLVHRFLALDYLAEYGITETVAARIIEAFVIGHVDEKLRGGGIRIAHAGHGNRVHVVGQAVLRFAGNRFFGGLGLEFFIVAAALDHEAVDHAVEDGALVEARFHVGQEIVDRFRRLFMVQFDDDVAGRGLDFHLRVGCRLGRGCHDRAGKDQAGQQGAQAAE